MKNSRQPSRNTPRIDQRDGQSRQQNGKSRIPWVQPPAAQARRCAAGNALAQHRHNRPSRIRRQKEAGIPPTEAPRPRIPAPASSPCPSRTGRRPAQWGSEPVRRKRGRNGWRCPQAGAPQRWRQGVRLLRYTVSFFPYDFPLLPLRRGGCSAFLLIFIYVGSAAHRAAAGKVMRMTVPSPGLLVRRISPW